MLSTRSTPTSAPPSPMSALRAAVRGRAAADPPIPMAGTTRLFSETDLDKDDTEVAGSQSNLDLSLGGLASDPAANLVMARLEVLKRQRTLTNESQRDFDEFTVGQTPYEGLAVIMLTVLENRDMLRLIGQEYQVPETVKTTCKDYSWIYLLSPAILSYKDKNAPGTILNAMRQLGVKNLPPSSETGRCEVVLELIKKALTDARHHVKEKLATSVKSSQDIAALTRAVIGNSKAKPTAPLFVRVAILRFQFVNQDKGAKNGDFWDKVDEKLANDRKQSPPAELQQVYTMVYEEDVKKYGRPDLITYPQVSVKDVDAWMLTVNNTAARVSAQ